MRQRKMKTRIAAAVMIVGLSASASYGFIVFDPVLEQTVIALNVQSEMSKYQQFIETLLWIKNQYAHMKEMQVYWERINGRWKDPLAILRDQQLKIASRVINIRDLGWGRVDEFRRIPSTRQVADALDELQRVMDARADRQGLAGVRDHLEEIFGDVPVTRNGAAVEAAYRDMAATAAFTGEANKAIAELIVNADRLKADIERGGLAPGDIERYQVLEADMRLRAQTLQAQAMNHNNRLLFHAVGLKAAEEARLEKSRIKDRDQRLQIHRMSMFSPRMQQAPGGIE